MTRASAALAVLAALLIALPALAGNYALSVATLILYFAYTGQAWNVMMGFAGQLSLGHALYVGVGGYAAGAIFYHWGIGPWAGLWVAMALCVLLGVIIGFLAFRFGISGVYFALLTIAFAELPTYFGYVMPRLEAQLKNGWVAWLIASFFLAAQHMFLPFILDGGYLLWRLGMFLPFALFTGLVLKFRPALLPYFMVVHALMDVTTVLVYLVM